MDGRELTTLARECDALVEKYGAQGDTIEELTADLKRRLGDDQARLRAEIDQLEARVAELDNEGSE
jgi:polyhydroxyalkanoate synthesis regulator phasin